MPKIILFLLNFLTRLVIGMRIKFPKIGEYFLKLFIKKAVELKLNRFIFRFWPTQPNPLLSGKLLQNQYQQIQRWAWGVSDDPWIIKSYFLARNIPFWDKTTRLISGYLGPFLSGLLTGFLLQSVLPFPHFLIPLLAEPPWVILFPNFHLLS